MQTFEEKPILIWMVIQTRNLLNECELILLRTLEFEQRYLYS